MNLFKSRELLSELRELRERESRSQVFIRLEQGESLGVKLREYLNAYRVQCV